MVSPPSGWRVRVNVVAAWVSWLIQLPFFLGNGVGKQGAGVRAADDEREDKRGNLLFHGVYML